MPEPRVITKRAAEVVVGDRLWNGRVGLPVYKVERMTLPAQPGINSLPGRDTVFLTFGETKHSTVRLFWPPDGEVEIVE